MTFDWWTLGLQAANVAVLVWLLHRFFWNPVAAVIARRRDEVQTVLADISDKQDIAARAVAETATTREGFAAERDAILAGARAEAGAEKAVILKAGRDAVNVLRSEAKDALSIEAKQAQKAAMDTAAALGLSIAGQLAARLDGPAVEAAFLDWMTGAIRAMADTDRQVLTRNGATADLVSATDLDPEAQARVTAALEAALGATPVLTFRTDPALIAGFELHSPHFVLRNSWQADLQRITDELRADQATGGQNTGDQTTGDQPNAA